LLANNKSICSGWIFDWNPYVGFLGQSNCSVYANSSPRVDVDNKIENFIKKVKKLKKQRSEHRNQDTGIENLLEKESFL
jgi:hypothetical protein